MTLDKPEEVTWLIFPNRLVCASFSDATRNHIPHANMVVEQRPGTLGVGPVCVNPKEFPDNWPELVSAEGVILLPPKRFFAGEGAEHEDARAVIG